MAEANAFLQDPRRRNLAALGALALLMLLLAILAVDRQAHETAPRYTPHAFLPQLAAQVRGIARIHIVSKQGQVDVAFRPEKGWVVASHADYPVSFEQLRQTVVGLAALQTIEPKTARADWLHYVDLDAPPRGAGVAITLLDEQGRRLASLITGKTEDIGDPSGAVGLFVRRADSNQSWLVRSVLQPKADLADWLDKQVIDIDLARIQEVDVDPAGGPSFDVRREKTTDADFSIASVPKGREAAYAGAADGVAAAIVGFAFDDVRPAKDFDFSDPTHVTRHVTKTFDGLTITVQTIQKGQDYWSVISAEGAATKPVARKEARDIDAHVSGWTYKIPSYKGQQFMTSLESLLKPQGQPSPQVQTKSAK